MKLIYSFIVFAESRNIVEAADKLKVSQPALSAYLKSFEEQLPQPVFTMQGRKKILTQFGQEIYLQLKDKVSGIDSLIEQTSLKYNNRETALVKIGGRSEILARILLKLPFPGQIIAVNCDHRSGISLVLKSQLDLLISQEIPDSLNLIAKPLFKDQFQILIPKKMKIEASTVSKKLLQQMASLPLLSYKSDFDQLQRLREHFGQTESQYTLRIFSDWQVLNGLCERGLGWTLSPTSFPFDETKCQRFLVPTEIIPATQFYLIYPKSLSKVRWFSELASSIQKVF